MNHSKTMRKGELGEGTVALQYEKEDVLDSVVEVKPPHEPYSVDVHVPSKEVSNAGKKAESKEVKERTGKFFQMDKALAKRMKMYAVEHEMKEVVLMETALKAYLDAHEECP